MRREFFYARSRFRKGWVATNDPRSQFECFFKHSWMAYLAW